MKTILKSFLVNLGALWMTSQILPTLTISGGYRGFLIGALALMVANILLIPILKVVLLPLNLLTLGIFAWLANIIALYLLVSLVPSIKVLPYDFPGAILGGIVLPAYNLTAFHVAVIASFLLAVLIQFFNWLIK